jgi:hypothetical protein
MKTAIISGLFLLLFSASSYAYLWSSAVPTEIHLVPDGLVLLGEFNNPGVSCATGPRAIFLPRIDPLFKEKLTLALTAKATAKKIRVVIADPIESSCINILAVGAVPIVSHYFWQLTD